MTAVRLSVQVEELGLSNEDAQREIAAAAECIAGLETGMQSLWESMNRAAQKAEQSHSTALAGTRDQIVATPWDSEQVVFICPAYPSVTSFIVRLPSCGVIQISKGRPQTCPVLCHFGLQERQTSDSWRV